MRARTREVYETLYEAKRELGVPPTLRQLTERMGLDANSHLSSVYYALAELLDLGLVEKHPPSSTGMYFPMYPPDKVDWETLGGDGDEPRETMESA